MERAVEEDEHDGARPALADQLDRAVVEPTARLSAALALRRRLALLCRANGHDVSLVPRQVGAQAACCRRPSSCEPSFGTSLDEATSVLKRLSDTCATASRICSSDQPASRASSWRWSGGAPPRDSSTPCTKRSSTASFSSRDSKLRASAISSIPRP